MSLDGEELAFVASACGADRARGASRVQSLWGGYGELVRVRLEGGARASVVVKRIDPPARGRGRGGVDAGDARKRRSYEVEIAWYRGLAARCDATCRVPELVGVRVRPGSPWLLVLEDLDGEGFTERTRRSTPEILGRCLRWLAAFHARFLGVAPDGLWKNGTYWHLATRTDELAAIDDPVLRAAAPELDRRLGQCTHRTIVHGDAKLANFCFGGATRGDAVAAVDFQYVGGGCGMKDVAYLLAGEGDRESEARLLDVYFAELRRASSQSHDLDGLEAEWRGLYPIAVADFYRFLAGWSKESWRHDRAAQARVRDVLSTLGT